MREKKTTWGRIVIASGIICIALLASLVIAILNYNLAVSSYNSMVSQKDDTIAERNNTISNMTLEMDSLKSQVEALQDELANLTAQTPQPGMTSVSYTIWFEDAYYYAKNGWTGLIEYHDRNFTYVFEKTLDALPTEGGIIHLKPAYYEGYIAINRDGVILEGEGAYGNVPPGIPDNPPTYLTGTVLKVTEPNKDAIHISGQRYGVHVRDIGIWFTQPNTGHAITDDMDQNYHMTYCSLSNIKILNHDKSHYAIQMSNFLGVAVNSVVAWGGPLINLYCNKDGFAAGNSNFYDVYGYIKSDLAPVDFTEGPYPIFVHKNDSLSSLWVNFLHFYRVQVNCPFAQSDPDYYEITLWDCRYSTFEGIDLEGVEGNKLKMGACQSVNFINAYMWSFNDDLYVDIACNNEENIFMGCRMGQGVVLDSCPTNEWVGCAIDGAIHKDSKAHFYNIAGNSGNATLPVGYNEIKVNTKFIGEEYMVFLQPFANASLEPGEGLKIQAIHYAPENYFTVTCIDGMPASKDIGFWWIIAWKHS